MNMDQDYKQELLDKTTKDKEPFSIDFFGDLFINQNINSGASTSTFQNNGGKAGFFKGLDSNEESGLNDEDAADTAKRASRWGDNKNPPQKISSFMDFVWESLEDQMLRVLLLAALVSLIIGILQEGLATGWIEGFSIFLAVFVVVSISSFQNYSKDQQFRKLDEENAKKDVRVKRKGYEVKEVDVESILVGDILHLTIGDILPADGILIKDSVIMDEGAMTGESDLLKKTTDESQFADKVNPFLISGTQVADGSGRMLVCAVGKNKVAGKSDDIMAAEPDKTPLQVQLEELADRIGDIGLTVAVFIAITMIVKDIVIRIFKGNEIFNSSLLDTTINAFIVCITVIVVAIPEGLPMAVTISLAFSVFKMKEEHNLVKHLDASETMGNVNNVCTDKTGTLTKGIMEVRCVYQNGQNLETNELNTMSDEDKNLLTEICTNNLTAYCEKVDGKMVAKGNPTEVAILQMMINQGFDYTGLRSTEDYTASLPFSSVYKYMVTIAHIKGNKHRLYIKGSPEQVLKFCSKIRMNDNYESIDKHMGDIKQAQENFASQCMRTIGYGYKDITQADLDKAQGESVEYFANFLKDVNLVGIYGIADAPRDDVFDSIRRCKSAGVTVRMVTGDNIKTAVAISKKVGIITEEESNSALKRIKFFENKEKEKDSFAKEPKEIFALEGNEFRELCGGYEKIDEGEDEEGKPKFKFNLRDPEKFRKTTANLKVVARASPDDKFLLVLGLQRLENIVAVTGDGTNDAPAMKKSDVGFAMGIRGTDAAKAASDIILLNDSFTSIVTAIKYGRNVYDCIKKFLQFQLTCNVVAVFMTLLGGVILEDSPLNPIQMLWVNLIMDSFASLALATEPPSDKLLERKPYPKSAGIITDMMKINITSQSLFQILILIIIIFYGDLMFDVPSDRALNHYTWNNTNGYHFTIFFNIFVFLQVFNSINARKLLKSERNIFENVFNNGMYLFIQLIIVGGQVLMVTYGGRALRTHPLTLNQHLGCMGIASLSLVVAFVMKLLPVGYDEADKKEIGFSISKSIRGKSVDASKVRSSKSIKMK